MSKISPMMQQYLEIKALHKDHVLFFRLGDFYEMFFDDAIKISKELELTLTGRDCGLEERAPMCGIPYHSSANYIKKLIDKGYKVAICEQVEDPATTKGIVKREVVRIITPGTLIEGDMLEDFKNNYIATIFCNERNYTACFADISTGDVNMTTGVIDSLEVDLIGELSKFSPSEILCCERISENKQIVNFVKSKLRCVINYYCDENIDISNSKEVIENHFSNQSFEELGIYDETQEKSLGCLITYLNQTQKDGAKRINKIKFYNENEFMNIDITARRNLEIIETIRTGEKKGTLLWVLDKTKTAMGKRFMRKALEQPLMNLGEITRRQNAVEEIAKDCIILGDIQEALSGVYDLERLMTRVLYNSATPRELRSLAQTIRKFPVLKSLTESFSSSNLKTIHNDINLLEDVANLIENSIVEEPPMLLKDGGYIKDGFNSTLDEYRSLCTNAKDIIAQIEQTERDSTGIKGLKIKYNKVFGYYIEVTNSYLNLVPDSYIRRQTLSNCERYVTEELKELEKKVLTASEKIISLESEIFAEIKKFISLKIDEIQVTADAIAKLDFLTSLSFVAVQNNYVCPQMVLDGRFDVKNGRHPVVEQMLRDTPFVPNDTYIDLNNDQMIIITGPNMAGKSTYMRQVAIITIMAQIGSFVPADSAIISIVDKIFTRVGASDDLSAGQSTFMVEMSEVAHVLKYATPRSLVILDEIGRGTSTFDGMSIAKSVIEYMVKTKSVRCKTLFATHYHELSLLEKELDGVKNYNIAVKKNGDNITFLRKIVPGGTDDSFGIEVAKLAGVPIKVIERAKEILVELETSNIQAPNIENQTQQSNQTNLLSVTSNEIENKIKSLQIDTITPIEALNILYELKKLVY